MSGIGAPFISHANKQSLRPFSTGIERLTTTRSGSTLFGNVPPPVLVMNFAPATTPPDDATTRETSTSVHMAHPAAPVAHWETDGPWR